MIRANEMKKKEKNEMENFFFIRYGYHNIVRVLASYSNKIHDGISRKRRNKLYYRW